MHSQYPETDIAEVMTDSPVGTKWLVLLKAVGAVDQADLEDSRISEPRNQNLHGTSRERLLHTYLGNCIQQSASSHCSSSLPVKMLPSGRRYMHLPWWAHTNIVGVFGFYLPS